VYLPTTRQNNVNAQTSTASCARVNVNLTGVHHSKEDAYRAVVMEGFAELSERLAATQASASEATLPWWDVVRLSISTYYDFAAENRELFVAMCAGGDTGAGLGRELQEQFAAGIAEILPATQRVDDERERMYPYAPALIARAIVAMLNHAVLWWIREGDGDMSANGYPRDDERLSLKALSDAMGRFVAAGLGGHIPGNEV
jgi:AcrR family transcriptional regulator